MMLYVLYLWCALVLYIVDSTRTVISGVRPRKHGTELLSNLIDEMDHNMINRINLLFSIILFIIIMNNCYLFSIFIIDNGIDIHAETHSFSLC